MCNFGVIGHCRSPFLPAGGQEVSRQRMVFPAADLAPAPLATLARQTFPIAGARAAAAAAFVGLGSHTHTSCRSQASLAAANAPTSLSPLAPFHGQRRSRSDICKPAALCAKRTHTLAVTSPTLQGLLGALPCTFLALTFFGAADQVQGLCVGQRINNVSHPPAEIILISAGNTKTPFSRQNGREFNAPIEAALCNIATINKIRISKQAAENSHSELFSGTFFGLTYDVTRTTETI